MPTKKTIHCDNVSDVDNSTGSVTTKYADVEDVDMARLYAAVTRTCLYLQSNYHLLSHREFNLLDNTTRWTGDQQLLIIRDRRNGKMFLNPERFQDACVNAEARDIHRQLEVADNDSTDNGAEDYLAEQFEEKELKKKRVMFEED